MTTAQHAGNLLEAWRFRDLSRFNIALDEALLACTTGIPVSRLEAECEEMLQSIVEHLREPNGSQQLSGAAITLLRHLSTSRSPKGRSEATNKKFLQEL